MAPERVKVPAPNLATDTLEPPMTVDIVLLEDILIERLPPAFSVNVFGDNDVVLNVSATKLRLAKFV